MKYIKYLLIIFLLGCGNSNPVSAPELEPLKFEFKHWDTRASRNLASTYPPWNRQSGLRVSYFVFNTDESDFKVEYNLIIKGARSQSDLQLIPIKEAPFLSLNFGLMSEEISTNGDPVKIVEDSILKSGDGGYVIAFAPINWDDWWSVWSTVTITATVPSAGLSKSTVYVFEETRLIIRPTE